MIGTVLAGRYRIQSKLGEGGMAIVYKALDVVLHRIVAMKVLRPQYAGDEEFVERFRREAQAAASLSHPNVVNIFDVGKADDVHYIVLEYVRGQNLKEIVRNEGRLTPRRAARIAAAVARALQAAHERQLVHRDIKPHNILITPEGRVKVTDFGIARATSASTLTEAGMVIGSVHYFSPEQARGQAVGPAADLYSLGVVLYEMLTGEVPFSGDSPVSVALQHLEQTPRPPRQLVDAIPVWLEQVVLKALAKEPGQRYRSAAEMAIDLAWRGRSSAGEAESFLSSDLTFRTERTEHRASETSDVAEEEMTKVNLVPVSAPYRELRTKEGLSASEEATRLLSLPKENFSGDKLDATFGPLAADDSAAAAEPEDNDGHSSRKRSRLWGWVITAALLIGIAFGVYAGAPLLLELIFPPEVDVPRVVGMTYDEARPLMQAAGLSMSVEAEVFDRHIPEGAIVRQNPEGGRIVRKGREITVVLSRGPELGTVPDVTGQSLRDARVLLTRAGYTLAEEIDQPDPSVPPNLVVAQEPLAGTELVKGTPVTLWVSKPAEEVVETVVVPDLRGKTLSAADSLLQELGLQPGNQWAEISLLVPPGRVIDQNPPAGAVLHVGDNVDVVYSEGLLGSSRPPTEPSRADATEDFTIVHEERADEAAESSENGQTGTQDTAFRFPFESEQENLSADDPSAPFGERDLLDEVVDDDAELDMDVPAQESQDERDDGAETDWEALLQAEDSDSKRRWANVDVYVPPGAAREVVILVIDDFGVREVLRKMVPGDTALQQMIDGRGDNARLQVYIDGVMQIDQQFPQ